MWNRMALAVWALAAASGPCLAQEGPDPREIPVPPIETPMGKLPGVNELPARPEMPDVMVMNDGTRVRTVEQWGERREELKKILEYYAVGQMPPAPGNVKGSRLSEQSVLDGKARYRLIRLTFGPEERLELHVGVFTPAEGGPFPAVILQTGSVPGAPELPRLPQGPNQGRGENVLLLVGAEPPPGAEPRRPRPARPPMTADQTAQRYEDVLRRGYALVVFNPNDCAEDTTLRNEDGSWAFRNTRFFPGTTRQRDRLARAHG